jgi:hypothetical protein
MTEITTLRTQLLGVVEQAQLRFGATRPSSSKRQGRADRKKKKKKQKQKKKSV